MAHELGHVKNRDTLVMTITATIAGAISMIGNFAMFAGMTGGNDRPNPIALIAAVIVAPFAAMLVQMAISRTREYAADRAGAVISGVPMALARSEEHTSELQSLMRISYSDFCFTKKKQL